MENIQFEVYTRARHLRNLFFIDNNYSHEKLVNLFYTNLNHWGGRYNPIVPIIDNVISDIWKKVLKYYDPDYIFHTSELEIEKIKEFCLELDYNPLDILNIDEPSNTAGGTDIRYLLPLIKEEIKLFEARNIWRIESLLKEFYKLNFLIETNTFFPNQLPKTITHIQIDENNYSEINRLISENRPFDKTTLSTLNLNTNILRAKQTTTKEFEIIIASNENSFDDYIYYWNRILFVHQHWSPNLSHIIVTQAQLEELLKDEWFKHVFRSFNTEHNLINLVSFSLSKQELEVERIKLQKDINYKRFNVLIHNIFPFDILDNSGLYEREYGENVNTQIIHAISQKINLPNLSFSNDIKSSQNAYAIDFEISDVKKQYHKLKLPYSADPWHIVGQKSRINKSRQISMIIDGSTDNKSIVKISIPSFEEIARQIITNPKILNKEANRKYAECKYNDESRKLSEFFSLFQNSLRYVEETIYDKFWFDIFYELSTNIRAEGDTIHFSDIYERCESKLKESGITLGPKKETFQNSENLEFSLKNTLQEFCNNKIFFAGYNIKCKNCSSKFWYAVEEIKNKIICKGCFNENQFVIENPMAYKINSLIKNNIARRDALGKFTPDGNLTVIKTLISLFYKSQNNFEYMPQLDIYSTYHSIKPETDLDIICLIDGRFCIGECKHNSSLFFENSKKSLNSLIEIAKVVRPTYLILSCTEDKIKGKKSLLSNATQYLKHQTSKWKSKPEILSFKTREPDYFNFSGHKYFYH
jgi:hypothetical protein